MFSFKILHSELEDRFNVPYYMVKGLLKELKQKIKMRSLSALSNCIISGRYVKGYIREGTLYLRAQNIRRNNINLNTRDIKFVDVERSKIEEKIRLKSCDVLLTRTGLYLGSACVAMENLVGAVISQHLTRIELKKDIDPFYVSVFLNSKYGRMQIKSKSMGMTRPELTHSASESIEIPILEDQDKIGILMKQACQKRLKAQELLSKANEMFLEESDIKLEDQKEEMIYAVSPRMLDSMLTPRYYYPKYVKIEGELEEHFQTMSLNEITEGDIKRGVEVGRENYREEGFPFIRTTDIINNEVDNYPDYYVSEDLHRGLDQDLRVGDILFTKDGRIGLSAMITNEDTCVLSSGIARIRVQKRIVNPHYAFAFLNTELGVLQAKRRVVVAATLPHLSVERLKAIKIPILSPKTQEEIGNLVQNAFQLIREAKRLTRHANGNLDKAIEGRLA